MHNHTLPRLTNGQFGILKYQIKRHLQANPAIAAEYAEPNSNVRALVIRREQLHHEAQWTANTDITYIHPLDLHDAFHGAWEEVNKGAASCQS